MNEGRHITPEEAIDLIIGEFDFRRVRKVMKSATWKWADDSGDLRSKMRVPKTGRIKKAARRLLREIVGSGKSQIAMGGLVAAYDKRGETLTLSFEVASTLVDLRNGEWY